MRRVNVKDGMKQRLPKILGTDEGVANTNGSYEITPWSIQAAMIENMQRIVSGMVGGVAGGRPVSGLVMSATGTDSVVNIASGIGFTQNGNMVILINNIFKSLPTTSATYHIYLKHILGILAESNTIPGGKKTNIIGSSIQKEIVYDDYASTNPSDITSTVVIVSTSTQLTDQTDHVYLGSVVMVDGIIASVSNSQNRGLSSSSYQVYTFQAIMTIPTASPESVNAYFTAIVNNGVCTLSWQAISFDNQTDHHVTGSYVITFGKYNDATAMPQAIRPSVIIVQPFGEKTTDDSIDFGSLQILSATDNNYMTFVAKASGEGSDTWKSIFPGSVTYYIQ